MTNEQMERRLAKALDKTTPNDVKGVLSRCDERKGTVIPMTTKKTTKRRWTTLAAIGEEERRIVLLHAITGMKHREIAALLELPLATVLSKYHRALKKMRAYLEGDDAR